jgi:hypothetical protein
VSRIELFEQFEGFVSDDIERKGGCDDEEWRNYEKTEQSARFGEMVHKPRIRGSQVVHFPQSDELKRG